MMAHKSSLSRLILQHWEKPTHNAPGKEIILKFSRGKAGGEKGKGKAGESEAKDTTGRIFS